MRLVFFGTPDFSVPALDALASEHEVILVVAQPDKPSGRGMKMQAPAVAKRATALGLNLLQPPRVRDEGFLASVRELRPDAGVVIAYGKILPAALLDIPRFGFLNIHASLLPRWRGAAPIQRAIEAGERVTGVTIMRVDELLDHGPMLATSTTEIDPDERAPELFGRLSTLGAAALLPVLRAIEEGVAVETPQDHDRATHAAKIEKSEGEVRFDEGASKIYDRFRAFDPWPGLFLQSGGEPIKLTEMRRGETAGPARRILALGPARPEEDSVVIGTGDGSLRILEMQRPGKPRTPAAVVARSLGWRVGEILP